MRPRPAVAGGGARDGRRDGPAGHCGGAGGAGAGGAHGSEREQRGMARSKDGKRLRYPGPDFVPCAIEALGCPGDDAVALLRAWAPEESADGFRLLGSA